MKKRLYYKKWKQELREAMREEIDGDYLTEKMVRKMSISDMSHYLNRLALEEAGYLRTVKKSLGRGRGVQTFRFFSDTKITDFQFEIMLQRLEEALQKLSTD